MYIIQLKDEPNDFLVYAESNKMQDGSPFDGWFFTGIRTAKILVKRAMRDEDNFGKKPEFIFQDLCLVNDFLTRFIIECPNWKRKDFKVISIKDFSLIFEHPKMAKISEIIRKWKNNAGIASKVVVSYEKNKYGFYKIILGTNHPGRIIGSHGSLIDIYRESICNQTIFYDISIRETIALI